MEILTKDDLGVALRLIRDAGRKIRDGCGDASLMLEAVAAATPILDRSSCLPREIEWLRAQLVIDCGSWQDLCVLSLNASTALDLKEVGRSLAGHMVDRAEAILAWLQTE